MHSFRHEWLKIAEHKIVFNFYGSVIILPSSITQCHIGLAFQNSIIGNTQQIQECGQHWEVQKKMGKNIP